MASVVGRGGVGAELDEHRQSPQEELLVPVEVKAAHGSVQRQQPALVLLQASRRRGE